MKLKEWLILIIPIVVIALIMLIPAIPYKIPMQFDTGGNVNWYLPKWVFPIIGAFPFLIYLKYRKNKD